MTISEVRRGVRGGRSLAPDARPAGGAAADGDARLGGRPGV